MSPLGKVTVSGSTDTGFSKSAATVTGSGGFLASFTQPALTTENFNEENTIAIYPNPSTGNFTIQNNESLVDASVMVYNVLGQMVKEFHLENTITNETLGTGMYLLQIEKEGVIGTKKLIVN